MNGKIKIKISKIQKFTNSKEDREEEVIYSEGEPFEGYLYPNNTWDSEDSMYGRRLFSKIWIYIV